MTRRDARADSRGRRHHSGQLMDEALATQAIWAVDVVLVSPAGSDLPSEVPVAEPADMQLVLPPDGSSADT